MVEDEGARIQRQFADRARGGSVAPASPEPGGRRLVRPAGGAQVLPLVEQEPVAEVGRKSGAPKPARLSWYMHPAEHEQLAAMRDDLYYAAGAAGMRGVKKQDVESALTRAIAADWPAIKHRALSDLLGKEPGGE